MLAPAQYTPVEVDDMEIYQVAVLVHADHPRAGQATGTQRLVEQAMQRIEAKKDKTAAARQPSTPPEHTNPTPTFGFTGPVADIQQQAPTA